MQNPVKEIPKFYVGLRSRYNDLERFHKEHPLFWQDIVELEALCKEILDWHSNTFEFNTLGDLYNHRTIEDTKDILHHLTFFEIARNAVASGKINPESYDYLLDKTHDEVNR